MVTLSSLSHCTYHMLTSVQVLYGCCENLGPDIEVQEFFSQLLQNDSQFQTLAPRYVDCGLALARGLTEANYRFLDTKAVYRGMLIVSVWTRSDLESNYGVCDTPNYREP